MKKTIILGFALILLLVVVYAVAPKTYQVTGPVLSIQGDIVTVQKGEEKWEVQKTPETQVTGKLAVGAKVTIEYKMVAAKITVR
jgi:hypothetical protein